MLNGRNGQGGILLINVYTHSVNGKDLITVYNYKDFPYDKLNKCKSKGTGRYEYDCTYATFDIETTSIKSPVKYAYMYHWQMCVGGIVIIGRRWEEWLFFMNKLADRLELNDKYRMVIYVHNLGYEFQFIKTFLVWSDIFSRNRRQIMRACDDIGYEYRCSYLLSNKSLQAFCKEEQVKHPKVVEDEFDEIEGFQYDYSIIRTPETPMSENEISYAINDVLGLYEAIESRLTHDDLHTIPMTSTGYVRRDVRNNCLKDPNYQKRIYNCRLTYEQYILMKEAFRGGDTCANPLYVGEIIDDVHSYDIVSSYIYVIMVMKFPMSSFIKVSSNEFYRILDTKKYAMIFRAKFVKLNKKTCYGMAYIPTAKCRQRKKLITANGRVFQADELEITLTDVDYRIIQDTYEWDNCVITDMYISKYDYLPEPIRQVAYQYFENKCKLKGLDSREYMKSKNKLNSIFGMMVTDILSDIWKYEEDNELHPHTPEPLSQLDSHYKSHKLFLSYQWGIWVTAHARYNLNYARQKVSEDMSIYNDTDSLKLIGNPKEIFDKINKEIIKSYDNVSIRPCVEHNGKVYYMGIWEYEGRYDKFRTWGAKKYATETNGEIEFTVSGVSKSRGKKTLEQGNGIEDFKPGLLITKCGNMSGTYNTEPPHYIEVDGVKMLTGSNLALFENDYLLGITNEYREFLKIN